MPVHRSVLVTLFMVIFSFSFVYILLTLGIDIIIISFYLSHHLRDNPSSAGESTFRRIEHLGATIFLLVTLIKINNIRQMTSAAVICNIPMLCLSPNPVNSSGLDHQRYTRIRAYSKVSSYDNVLSSLLVIWPLAIILSRWTIWTCISLHLGVLKSLEVNIDFWDELMF